MDRAERYSADGRSTEKVVPDKKEHPVRISVITLILAYSTFFYGLWYGINRDMGYEVRYRFAEISIAVITISLAILLIWGNRKHVQTQLPGIIHTAW